MLNHKNQYFSFSACLNEGKPIPDSISMYVQLKTHYYNLFYYVVFYTKFLIGCDCKFFDQSTFNTCTTDKNMVAHFFYQEYYNCFILPLCLVAKPTNIHFYWIKNMHYMKHHSVSGKFCCSLNWTFQYFKVEWDTLQYW